MAGPVSGSSPTQLNWQLPPTTGPQQGPTDTTSPTTTKPLNLELPKPAITLPPQSWQDTNTTNTANSSRFHFEQADVQFNHPMTRGELVDNVRGSLHENLGDAGGTTVEAVAGAAYLATGGKFEVKHDTQLFNQPAEVKFSASARHGGTVGIGFHMNLGGR